MYWFSSCFCGEWIPKGNKDTNCLVEFPICPFASGRRGSICQHEWRKVFLALCRNGNSEMSGTAKSMWTCQHMLEASSHSQAWGVSDLHLLKNCCKDNWCRPLLCPVISRALQGFPFVFFPIRSVGTSQGYPHGAIVLTRVLRSFVRQCYIVYNTSLWSAGTMTEAPHDLATVRFFLQYQRCTHDTHEQQAHICDLQLSATRRILLSTFLVA